MTAEQKAKERVEHYYQILTGKELDMLAEFVSLPDGFNFYKKAKQCAISEVQAIIDNCPMLPYGGGYYETWADREEEAVIFWQSVLTEINKL